MAAKKEAKIKSDQVQKLFEEKKTVLQEHNSIETELIGLKEAMQLLREVSKLNSKSNVRKMSCWQLNPTPISN